MPTDEEIIDELELREQASMTILLSAAAERTAITINEYIQLRLTQGASAKFIEAELIKDLNEGGRVFGQFRNAVKATARGNLRRVADIGNFTENGIEIDYTWITVQDNKVCPDCGPLHGDTRKWDEWEGSIFGLPRSGGTVCRDNCRCILALSDAPAFPAEPVIRKKRK